MRWLIACGAALLVHASNCWADEPTKKPQLLAPSDLTLSALERRESFRTEMGSVALRWDRAAEAFFGKTPDRGVIEAMRAARRALRESGLVPYEVVSTDWKIVIVGEKLLASEVPLDLISGCHPGWMTPPSNIYLVAERIADQCSGVARPRNRADGALIRVLLHEIGHVVEYHLLRQKFSKDRARAEGFASWFEQFSSDFAPIVAPGEARAEYARAAREGFRLGLHNRPFGGTFYDYGLAALPFMAVAKKGGPRKIVDVYESLYRQDVELLEAIKAVMYWNDKTIEQEMIQAATP